MSAVLRARLVHAMAETMNIWTWEYAHSTSAVVRALLDGRLPVDLLHAYPVVGYPHELSRAIAQLAGEDAPDGATDEEIGVAVEVLRAVADGQVSINDAGFSFHEDILGLDGLTLDQARAAMRQLTGRTVPGAARLLADAFAVRL